MVDDRETPSCLSGSCEEWDRTDGLHHRGVAHQRTNLSIEVMTQEHSEDATQSQHLDPP